jgi:hypothetical protein
MLKGVGIDRQPMQAGISVVAEFTRQDFVEESLAPLATLRYFRTTFRAAASAADTW